MLIHPGEWKPVIGGEGEPILIQDPDTKALFHTFENEGCMQRIVVQEEDCLGPDPSPATTSAPSSSPSSTIVVTKQPTSLRGGDKCEPICASLRGCYLFDFNSGTELPLVTGSPVDAFASHALSVRCEMDGPIGLVEFVSPDGTVINEETEAPFWMMGRHPFCLLYTSPSPRDLSTSRIPSSA